MYGEQPGGVQAERAEIDENVVRSSLFAVEYGEMLLRRKEHYEALHPETKATYEGGRFKSNQYGDVVADKMSAIKRSFVRNVLLLDRARDVDIYSGKMILKQIF